VICGSAAPEPARHVWRHRRDLNPRPPARQAGTLSSEIRRRTGTGMARLAGFEPAHTRITWSLRQVTLRLETRFPSEPSSDPVGASATMLAHVISNPPPLLTAPFVTSFWVCTFPVVRQTLCTGTPGRIRTLGLAGRNRALWLPLSYRGIVGLAGRIRTCGLLVPNEARFRLRYSEMDTGVPGRS
jgi:hypothetical protein